MLYFFFKQKTAYKMRISDWSSDVCSSDLSYEHSAAAVSVYLDQSASHVGDAANDSFTAIEDLRGSGFDDILSGDSGANRLEGLGGDDALHGLDGNDDQIGRASCRERVCQYV